MFGDTTAGDGGGSKGKGGGGGGNRLSRWWRDRGGMDDSLPINNLAATWNNPTASTFAIKISSADSVPALLNAIDLILCSQENLYRKSNDVCPADSYDTLDEDPDPLSRLNDLDDLLNDGENLPQFLVEEKGYDQDIKKRRTRKTMDQALTIAAAMTCLRLSDVICQGLLPQIEKGAEIIASLSAERVGKILNNIGSLRKSSDLLSLQKAVCQNIALFDSNSTCVAYEEETSWVRRRVRENPRDSLIRLRAFTETVPEKLQEIKQRGSEHSPPTFMQQVETRGNESKALKLIAALARCISDWNHSYCHENSTFFQEVLFVLLFIPHSLARRLFKSLCVWKDSFSEAISNVVQENLRQPMKAISKLLFEKPAGNEMQEAVERSRSQATDLERQSFYKDELRRPSVGGMDGIMKRFEQEMRSPIKGALTGKLLRAVHATSSPLHRCECGAGTDTTARNEAEL
eukprot:750329-Hanusia_phi.AAC.1